MYNIDILKAQVIFLGVCGFLLYNFILEGHFSGGEQVNPSPKEMTLKPLMYNILSVIL